jgi:hypothetical protein
MEIVLSLERLLQDESFRTKSGDVRVRHSFVGKTQGQYSRLVKVDIFNDTVWQGVSWKVGETYDVSLDADSREYNGRWYTSLTAWRVGLHNSQNSQVNNGNSSQQSSAQVAQPSSGGGSSDENVPF